MFPHECLDCGGSEDRSDALAIGCCPVPPYEVEMTKTKISIMAFVLAAVSSLAHASLATDARAFKNGVKTAGKQTGHAVRDAAHAVGRGAKGAGHTVAGATRNGYHATKRAVTGHE